MAARVSVHCRRFALTLLVGPAFSLLAPFPPPSRFNEQYRAFVKLWKTVLAEKKELNAKVQALKRGQKQAEQVRKKCNQAELKQPRDEEKLLKAKAQLVSVEEQCDELRKEMEAKVLEVQQDKHQCLRLGYTSLYNATMTRFKDQCAVQEKVRQLLNAFPVVTGRRDDASFTFADYEGPRIERPLWDQGEEVCWPAHTSPLGFNRLPLSICRCCNPPPLP